MMLTIGYCPELNTYTVDNGLTMTRIVDPSDFAPGARLEQLAPVFKEAREAVESGRAVMGIHVEV
jgi:hypothetical protein